METSIITSVFLPLALGIIMLGMGLSLTLADFKRIAIYPQAAAIGVLTQIVVLPIVGFLILMLFPNVSPEIAVGVMILAACPGGPTSNLITHIAKGDTALSISLTALSSIVVVVTMPLIINSAMQHFMAYDQYTALPVLETSIKVIVVTLIPVGLGMLIHAKVPNISKKMDKPVRITSGIILILVILAAMLKDKENIVNFFAQAGPVTLALNVSMLFIAFFIARAFSISNKQALTISIEAGIQNGTLGITIAVSILNNAAMSIPSAIYSLIMFITAAVVIFLANFIFSNKLAE